MEDEAEELKCYNGVVVDSVEALCVCLRQLAFPGRYGGLVPGLARPVPQLSMITNMVIDGVYKRYGNLLLSLDKQYIGKSEWPFNIRLNNYRHRIRSTNFDKLLPVEQHFRQPDHNFSIHAKFTIIEKIETAPPETITTILEPHEDRWIKRLKTLCPNGLNNKLNQP